VDVQASQARVLRIKNWNSSIYTKRINIKGYQRQLEDLIRECDYELRLYAFALLLCTGSAVFTLRNISAKIYPSSPSTPYNQPRRAAAGYEQKYERSHFLG
jgi:hypothetical protein